MIDNKIKDEIKWLANANHFFMVKITKINISSMKVVMFLIYKIYIIMDTENDIFINGLNSIKYNEMIGGPLKACIESQAVAAMRSWRFLQECGLGGDVQKYYDMLNFAKPFIEANKSPEIFELLSQLNEELSDAITEINKKQQ